MEAYKIQAPYVLPACKIFYSDFRYKILSVSSVGEKHGHIVSFYKRKLLMTLNDECSPYLICRVCT